MVPFFPLVQNRDGFASTLSLGYVYDYMTEMESSSDEELLPDTSSNDVVDVFESSADAFDDRLQITREDFPFSLEILNEDIWRNTNKNLSVNWRIKSSSLSKSNKRKNKFKNRKKHHHQQWNHPRFYEGTNRKKLNGNGSENWLVLSDQKDVHKGLLNLRNFLVVQNRICFFNHFMDFRQTHSSKILFCKSFSCYVVLR